MFGISFFSNHVGNRLVKMGPSAPSMQEILEIRKPFKLICDALKSNGYDADQAADLWYRCWNSDVSAIKEMRNNTGMYGVMLFGSEDLDD